MSPGSLLDEIMHPRTQSHGVRFSTQIVEWEGDRRTLVIEKVPRKQHALEILQAKHPLNTPHLDIVT